jgi:biotin transporter BioY
MFHCSPFQTLFLGLAQIAIGIGFFFLPLSLQVFAWVLILTGSMVLFLAGYLWFNHMISKASEKNSK